MEERSMMYHATLIRLNMDYEYYLKLTLLRQQFRTMVSNSFQKHLKKKMKSVNLKKFT